MPQPPLPSHTVSAASARGAARTGVCAAATLDPAPEACDMSSAAYAGFIIGFIRLQTDRPRVSGPAADG